MIATIKPYLGKGLYTPQEAAFYARLETRTLNRWLFGNQQGKSVVAAEFEKSEERLVSFLDFVQALAIRAIRSKHKIPLQKIRDAVDIAREKGIEYPFAQRHTTYLFSDQQDSGHGDIVVKVGGHTIQASGKAKHNLIMIEVAELYMRDLHFDEDSGLATSYVAYRSSESSGPVVMDPKVRFGEPILQNCGFTAHTLYEAYKAEGGVSQAADAYGVQREDVELALEYFDHLLSSSAGESAKVPL